MQKSLQKCIDLSLSFKPTPLHYTMHSGWVESHLNPTFLTGAYKLLSSNVSGICLKCSLNGVSSVTLITCLVEWVQPNLLGSRQKTLWYSAKKDQVESASLGGEDSNPHMSNSLKNFSCLCFMVNLGMWRPGASVNASVSLVCTGSSSTHVTA